MKNIVASTASPYKFAADVLASLGRDTTGKQDKDILEELSSYTKTEIPLPLAGLFGKPVRFTESIARDKDCMAQAAFGRL